MPAIARADHHPLATIHPGRFDVAGFHRAGTARTIGNADARRQSPGVSRARHMAQGAHRRAEMQPLEARSVRELPQLPACEFLTLAGVERLDGIEAFPRLRNLKLETDVRDFAPLAARWRKTHLLHLFGLQAALPAAAYRAAATAMRHVRRQYFNLPPGPFSRAISRSSAASPQLRRQLHVTDCPPVALEVAAPNATLPPWDDVLLAETPRPLPAKSRIITAPPGKSPAAAKCNATPATMGRTRACANARANGWYGFVSRKHFARLGAADWGMLAATANIARSP